MSRFASSAGVALRGPPVRESQVDALGELGEMQLHPLPQRLLQRMEHPLDGPRERLRERLGLQVRLMGAVQRAVRLAHDHPRAVGKELGRRGQRVEQERRERLGALDEQPVGQALQLIGVAVRVQRGGLGGAPAQRLVRDQLAHGGHVDVHDLLRGELRRGNELAQRFDLVAPVLQANRTPRGAGEDVDDAAAHRELAAVLDDVGARVAELHERSGQDVGRQLEARRQLQRGNRAEGRDHPLHRRERGRDHHERALGASQPREGVRAARRDLGRRRDALVRQGLPRGQQRDALRSEIRLKVGGERLSLAGTRRHRHHGHVQGHGDRRDHQVLRGLRPGHDGPRALQQQPLERLGRDDGVHDFAQAQPTSRDITNSPVRSGRRGLSWSV